MSMAVSRRDSVPEIQIVGPACGPMRHFFAASSAIFRFGMMAAFATVWPMLVASPDSADEQCGSAMSTTQGARCGEFGRTTRWGAGHQAARVRGPLFGLSDAND